MENVAKDSLADMLRKAVESEKVRSNEDFKLKVDIEREILSKHNHETLLEIASAMSVYINTVMPILIRNEPIMVQTFINGINHAKNIHAKKASKISHQSHYKIKEELIQEYLTNRGNFKSKMQAAEIFSKQYHISFDTARKHLRNI